MRIKAILKKLEKVNDRIPRIREVIYIAGAISGTNDYMERFKNAENVIRKSGRVPINPTIISKPLLEANANHQQFMSVTIELLKCCNGIYLLNGWEHSTGAKEELRYALAYNYNIYTEEK